MKIRYKVSLIIEMTNSYWTEYWAGRVNGHVRVLRTIEENAVFFGINTAWLANAKEAL